jgi:hypothetical protein
VPYLPPTTIPTTEFICRRLVIPADLNIVIAITGALSELTFAGNWESGGDVTPEEIAAAMSVMLSEFLESNHACP